MATVASDTKLCESCLTQQPIDEFRRRSRSGEARASQCRRCHNAAERARRAARQRSAHHRQIGRFATRLKNEPSSDRAAALCNAVVDRFGGVERFATAWADQIAYAMTHRPGSPRVLNSLVAIMRLQDLAAARESEYLDSLDAEDLEAVLAELLRKNPDLLADADDANDERPAPGRDGLASPSDSSPI